jgi:hypothetical protein
VARAETHHEPFERMKQSVSFFSAILFALLAGPTASQETARFFPQQMDAKELLLLCASSALTSNGRLRRRYCDGFVSGVEEGLRVHHQRFPSQIPKTVCVPVGTNSRAMSEAFVTYASRNGVELGKPAAAVVIDALEASFQC